MPVIIMTSHFTDKIGTMSTLRGLSKSRSFVSLWLLFFIVGTFVSVCDAETAGKSPDIDQHQNHPYHQNANEDSDSVEFSHLDRAGKYCCDALSAHANKLPAILHFPSVPDIGQALADFSPLVPIAPNLYRSADWRSVQYNAARLPVYLLTRRLRI